MGYIYMIWNDINDKLYIGKTEDTVENRFAEHCNDYKKERNEKRPLYNAMRKYGVEHFFVKTIEQCENANEREVYWIAHYDTYHNGYNATRGGDGAQYADYDAICDAYRAGKNQAEIARELGYDKGTVHNALISRGVAIRDAKTIMQDSLGSAVEQYDVNTGELIDTYASALSAAESLGKANGKSNGAASHITDVCKGKRNSAYGYNWKFAA